MCQLCPSVPLSPGRRPESVYLFMYPSINQTILHTHDGTMYGIFTYMNGCL